MRLFTGLVLGMLIVSTNSMGGELDCAKLLMASDLKEICKEEGGMEINSQERKDGEDRGDLCHRNYVPSSGKPWVDFRIAKQRKNKNFAKSKSFKWIKKDAEAENEFKELEGLGEWAYQSEGNFRKKVFWSNVHFYKGPYHVHLRAHKKKKKFKDPICNWEALQKTAKKVAERLP